MKKLMFVAMGILAGVTGGCVVAPHGDHADVYGPTVAIRVGHVHSDDCGHYQHRSNWHHARDHRHGNNCGHVARGGIWITAN